jgi:DNA-binding NarL/FixJ family response regulator
MYSILIIEDDPAYRSMMETILKMEGFEVQSASNGHAGLELVAHERPDMILCDIMMPGLDGHSVLESIRKNVTCAEIPFIFVSALGERRDVRRGMSAGADDYLPKPFSADELLAAVTGRIRRLEIFSQQHATLITDDERSMLQKITRREREVLLMVGHGSTSKEIAECLGVCLKTVEVHRSNLMNKLEASNAACLARWAVIVQQTE